MATQNYRNRFDHTVGENSGTKRPVHPAVPELNVKPGGENKTPAPVKAPNTTAEMARSTSWGRSSGDIGGNPGQNGFGLASSLNPGERSGPATINPQATTDVVLDAIIKGGAHGAQVSDDWQTRPVDSSGVAPSYGMKLPNKSGEIVPAKTGVVASNPVRKPS